MHSVVRPTYKELQNCITIVLDARLRCKVADPTLFSLFFMVERTRDPKTLTNLTIQYASVDISASMTLPTKEKLLRVYKESAPKAEEVCVGVSKNKLLIVRSAGDLNKIEETEAKPKQAEAKIDARAVRKCEKDYK